MLTPSNSEKFELKFRATKRAPSGVPASVLCDQSVQTLSFLIIPFFSLSREDQQQAEVLPGVRSPI